VCVKVLYKLVLAVFLILAWSRTSDAESHVWFWNEPWHFGDSAALVFSIRSAIADAGMAQYPHKKFGASDNRKVDQKDHMPHGKATPSLPRVESNTTTSWIREEDTRSISPSVPLTNFVKLWWSKHDNHSLFLACCVLTSFCPDKLGQCVPRPRQGFPKVALCHCETRLLRC